MESGVPQLFLSTVQKGNDLLPLHCFREIFIEGMNVNDVNCFVEVLVLVL